MTLHRRLCAAALGAALVGVASCGGGGSGASSGTGSGSVPGSGAFAWILKAQGPTNALQYGLSLVHPSAPNVEYVVEFGSSVVTDAKVISSGVVDSGALTAGPLAPYALIYIIGGDVRRVPLQASGTAPISLVQRAQSTTACSFILEANDYAAPENSRYIVSTAGADGQCGTADDGRAEVRLGGANGLTFAPIAGDAPLGMFRDAATLAPRGWILPKSVTLWGAASDTTVVTRGSTDPSIASVVASSYRSVLVDDGTKLSVFDFPAGANPVETMLDPGTSGGGGWLAIGFDSNAFYAYRNSGTTPATSSWEVLGVGREMPVASVLASGSGLLSVASMGRAQLYLTVLGSAQNQLLRLAKTGGGPATPLETTSTSTLSTVQTSASDVHELWRVANVGTANAAYTIEMIDETGAALYTTSAGGFPMNVAEASVVNLNASESRNRFLFADGYGARAFGDASLVGYDAAARSSATFGALPGTTAFGNSFVFAGALGGPGNFMGGFGASSIGGIVQQAGTMVFSFDFTVPGSLTYTTTKQ
jgi:hypothetical protein